MGTRIDIDFVQLHKIISTEELEQLFGPYHFQYNNDLLIEEQYLPKKEEYDAGR